MWSIIRPMCSGEPRNIMPPPMPPPMPWCMPPMPWRSPQPCMPPMRSPRGGAAMSEPLAGGGGAGCDHADRLSAASSVISMPIITHRTRRAADAVAAIACALLISLLLRPTAGE